MKGRLPEEILHRRKMGFPVPVGAWLRGPWRHLLDEFVTGPARARPRPLRPTGRRATRAEHIAAANQAESGSGRWSTSRSGSGSSSTASRSATFQCGRRPYRADPLAQDRAAPPGGQGREDPHLPDAPRAARGSMTSPTSAWTTAAPRRMPRRGLRSTAHPVTPCRSSPPPGFAASSPRSPGTCSRPCPTPSPGTARRRSAPDRGAWLPTAFDVVVCDFLVPAVNVPRRLRVPSVLFQHNVEAEIWAATRGGSTAMPWSSAYMALQWRPHGAVRARGLPGASRTWWRSPTQDAELFRQRYGVPSRIQRRNRRGH